MNTLSFTASDVGGPRLRGGTVQSAAGLEIVAGGEDIWGSRDEFHFAHTLASGDFELCVRLESLTMADVYTKAGLMMRTSLEAGAEHAMMLAFGDNQPRNKNNGGLEFQYRESADGPCAGIYPPQPLPAQPDFPVSFPNVWLKLIRNGETIIGRSSRDGAIWTTFCTHRQQLPRSVHVGLAVTSHNVNQTVQAVFSDIKFTQRP
jgi:hypothetical protein